MATAVRMCQLFKGTVVSGLLAVLEVRIVPELIAVLAMTIPSGFIAVPSAKSVSGMRDVEE